MSEQVSECYRQMFASYGQQATPERVAMYAEVVGDHDPIALRDGIRDAMREAGEWPPGPGTVRRHVLAVAGMRPGDPPREMPRDSGPRIGPGAAPTAQILGGLEHRVERNYQRVIARAREIRAERRLPDTLDARLFSLGVAESELHYVEDRYACRCWPRCADLDRRLAETRRAAEERLRLAGAV